MGICFDETLLHLEPDWHCRDIRYRFDRKADIARCVETGELHGDSEGPLKEFLRLARVDFSELGQEELADVVSHLGHMISNLEVSIDKAAREGVTLDLQLVREVLTPVEKRDILYNNAATFLRLRHLH